MWKFDPSPFCPHPTVGDNDLRRIEFTLPDAASTQISSSGQMAFKKILKDFPIVNSRENLTPSHFGPPYPQGSCLEQTWINTT